MKNNVHILLALIFFADATFPMSRVKTRESNNSASQTSLITEATSNSPISTTQSTAQATESVNEKPQASYAITLSPSSSATITTYNQDTRDNQSSISVTPSITISAPSSSESSSSKSSSSKSTVDSSTTSSQAQSNTSWTEEASSTASWNNNFFSWNDSSDTSTNDESISAVKDFAEVAPARALEQADEKQSSKEQQEIALALVAQSIPLIVPEQKESNCDSKQNEHGVGNEDLSSNANWCDNEDCSLVRQNIAHHEKMLEQIQEEAAVLHNYLQGVAVCPLSFPSGGGPSSGGPTGPHLDDVLLLRNGKMISIDEIKSLLALITVGAGTSYVVDILKTMFERILERVKNSIDAFKAYGTEILLQKYELTFERMRLLQIRQSFLDMGINPYAFKLEELQNYLLYLKNESDLMKNEIALGLVEGLLNEISNKLFILMFSDLSLRGTLNAQECLNGEYRKKKIDEISRSASTIQEEINKLMQENAEFKKRGSSFFRWLKPGEFTRVELYRKAQACKEEADLRKGALIQLVQQDFVLKSLSNYAQKRDALVQSGVDVAEVAVTLAMLPGLVNNHTQATCDFINPIAPIAGTIVNWGNVALGGVALAGKTFYDYLFASKKHLEITPEDQNISSAVPSNTHPIQNTPVDAEKKTQEVQPKPDFPKASPVSVEEANFDISEEDVPETILIPVTVPFTCPNGYHSSDCTHDKNPHTILKEVPNPGKKAARQREKEREEDLRIAKVHAITAQLTDHACVGLTPAQQRARDANDPEAFWQATQERNARISAGKTGITPDGDTLTKLDREYWSREKDYNHHIQCIRDYMESCKTFNDPYSKQELASLEAALAIVDHLNAPPVLQNESKIADEDLKVEAEEADDSQETDVKGLAEDDRLEDTEDQKFPKFPVDLDSNHIHHIINQSKHGFLNGPEDPEELEEKVVDAINQVVEKFNDRTGKYFSNDNLFNIIDNVPGIGDVCVKGKVVNNAIHIATAFIKK